MKQKKSVLQKIAYYSASISFLASAASLIFLYLRIDDYGFENPISASLLASTFFFLSVAAVLMVIAKSNLPSFKLNHKE